MNHIIYQTDESIFDARGCLNHAWSLPNKQIEIMKTSDRDNKMIAIQTAISSWSGLVVSNYKRGYFDSNDTIELLQKLLKLHKHRHITIFWDNHSIHIGDKVTKFLATQHRLHSTTNLKAEPELNGIETYFGYLKH